MLGALTLPQDTRLKVTAHLPVYWVQPEFKCYLGSISNHTAPVDSLKLCSAAAAAHGSTRVLLNAVCWLC